MVKIKIVNVLYFCNTIVDFLFFSTSQAAFDFELEIAVTDKGLTFEPFDDVNDAK